ncbi:DUF6470 family protein [Paenibacillus radicis (ex Xue et al. 2023)]|uniref:DUF6470 family protein n=1 Tax=Paenibacillus radicis (ex Xue et al. 2023) TaxID=2972489 RepID=A0ABT1YJC2_9BACL|nr:DUF6470 family protein [Paenibacillus radicis (ex Xue et al. 2023)]MCR8632368.1 DUF6470 family protein [Paenibacillus radicis (ex Xue et al. 2023)]
MSPVPQIQYRQEHASFRIDADLGQYQIKQPRPTQEIRQVAAQMDIKQPKGDLDIDQSKAWDALGKANNLEVMQRIYSQAKDIALQGIGRRVEEGNRMAQIKNPGNAFAEIAQNIRVSFPEMKFEGEASYDNVDIHYTAGKPDIQVQEGGAEITAQVNPPEINYERGKFDFQMLSYAKIEFTPPQLDTRL